MTIAEIHDTECPICLEDMKSEEVEDQKKLIQLKCEHIFHHACILLWVKKGTCPSCRAPIEREDVKRIDPRFELNKPRPKIRRGRLSVLEGVDS